MTKEEVVACMKNPEWQIPKYLSDKARGLLLDLTHTEPDRRINASDGIRHAFVYLSDSA